MFLNQTMVQSNGFSYEIVRKYVKNINLHINRNGEIIVSAPIGISKEQIDSFVYMKKEWIMKHQKEVEQRQNRILLNDEMIVLFGRTLKIKTIVHEFNQITYDDANLYVMHRSNKKPQVLIQEFLTQLCHDVFHDVTAMTIRIMREHPTNFPEIKIRQMKSQWGNCHWKTNYITLNKQLIHYPFEFIEYVVLHELTHFHVMNHSDAFYQIIESYMPDYKQRIMAMKLI